MKLINTKSQMYELMERGALGNSFRIWHSVEDLISSGFDGLSRHLESWLIQFWYCLMEPKLYGGPGSFMDIVNHISEFRKFTQKNFNDGLIRENHDWYLDQQARRTNGIREFLH